MSTAREHQGQLSRGLRLASFFGAATLVAAITALMQRFWGGFTLPAQLTLLTVFPLVALAGVHDRGRTGADALRGWLFALVACGTAWVGHRHDARLLDMPFTALLLWPASRLWHGGGDRAMASARVRSSLAMLVVAVASVFFAAGGVPWPMLFQRLEPLAGAAFVLLVMARHLARNG